MLPYINKSFSASILKQTNSTGLFLRPRMLPAYLLSDLDKQSKHEDDEQVVKDADCSDDDVDDFECEVTDGGQIQLLVVI